ncbi:MAG TPA: hypothetical protein GX746_04890 [Bacteroidales bacterium]|nr:hypothetical protein [Bacteroidales bacterium]
MFTHHLFWITLALLFCSAMNINVYFKYSEQNMALQNSIGVLGILGLLAGHTKLVMLSLEYNWWWLVAGLAVSILSIGVFSFLFRSKMSSFFGIINFIVIPFLWWYGSRFNTILSFDWFYSLVDIIRNFFQ